MDAPFPTRQKTLFETKLHSQLTAFHTAEVCDLCLGIKPYILIQYFPVKILLQRPSYQLPNPSSCFPKAPGLPWKLSLYRDHPVERLFHSFPINPVKAFQSSIDQKKKKKKSIYYTIYYSSSSTESLGRSSNESYRGSIDRG